MILLNTPEIKENREARVFPSIQVFTHVCVLWCDSVGTNHPKGQSNIPQIFTAVHMLINSRVPGQRPHSVPSPRSGSAHFVKSTSKKQVEVLTHRPVRAATQGCREEISQHILEHGVILLPKCLLDYQQFVALAQNYPAGVSYAAFLNE